MSATQNPSRNLKLGRLFLVTLVIAGGVALALASRGGAVQKPVVIGTACGTPTAIQCQDGAWYWIEESKKTGCRLVRATSAGIQQIASAETIHSYAIDSGRIVWAGRDNKRWTITVSAADGADKHEVWTGDEEPLGLTLATGRIYWIHQMPAPIPDGDPFPPLSPTLEVQSIASEGGKVAVVSRLLESEDGAVLGASAGALYVAAFRHTPPGSVSIYRILPDGTQPTRIVGESGNHPMLLTHDGVLYWLAPSSEATSACCLRRLDKKGQVESLTDWLPVTSKLYETRKGVICGDSAGQSNLWPAGTHDVYPEPLPVPEGYYPLAAGESELLLVRADANYSAPTLYRMPLP